MKMPDSYYERFTPRERITLFWEAMARRDHNEANRLIDTCSKKTYRMPDAAYSEGVRCIYEVCLLALLMIAQAQSSALALMGLIALASDSESEEPRRIPNLDKIIEKYRHAENRIRGIWEAWGEFCATAGVDPEAVMRASWGDVPECITRPFAESVFGAELAGMIEPDPDAKKVALGLFQARWEMYQERDYS